MARRKGQKDKQHNGQKKRDRRTSNTMTKKKGTEEQATQWSKEQGQKDKQHNGQRKGTEGQATQ